MATKNNPSLSITQRIQAAFKSTVLWLFKTGCKLTLALVLGLIIYLIYLDTIVTRKFEGRKWQIPAQIYAQPLKLTQGLGLTKAQLSEALLQLNYRRVEKLSGAGQFLVSHNHISLVRRAFDFAQGAQGVRWLIVEFAQGRVVNVIDRQTQQVLAEARLEPLLIERLLSPHQQDRAFLPLESFPELFKDTLLLVEDRAFYHHHGVSITAIIRALWQNLKAGRTVQGGSTLTQQLAKNFYLNHKRNLWRKINEAFIALLLDYRYSKDQILEAYVNEVFLGQFHNRSIHGFGLASYYYFSKPINELQPQEFAVLASIIKGPSYYNPHRQAERLLKRRDLILRLMFKHHLLDKKQYQLAIIAPLAVSDKKQFLPLRFPAYISQVKKDLRQAIDNGDMLSEGIRVFTHLDPIVQQATERVIQTQLPLIEAQFDIQAMEAASISVDIRQGAITAMVGSRNVGFSGLNRVTDMKRNIGSLIKPALYLQALSQPKDYSLATMLNDQPITLSNGRGQQWSPQNFDKKYQGSIALIDALAKSKNVPTVNLGMTLGVDELVDSLRRLGINDPIKPYPSLFLGALALSPLQVSQMYATLADRGVYTPLSTLQAVTDNQGQLIWQRQVKAKLNFDMAAVYLLGQALQKVTRQGSARRLQWQVPGMVFAGKTGTTDELRDSWFSGFDAKNLTTFWLGKDDYSSVGLTGSQGALRLFGELYKQVPGYPIDNEKPAGIGSQWFSPLNGKPVAEGCKGAVALAVMAVSVVELSTCD